MYRVLKPFEFFEPSSIDTVIEFLFRHGTRAKVMAGGVDLVLKMRLRLLQPEYVVSLQKIPGLDYIEGNLEAGLRFGALTTLREIELSPCVQHNWAILHDAVRQISSIQTKVMGTVVGNLCVATPASDISPVLFILGAVAKITGDSQEKEIPVEELFITRGETILKSHEIIREISVPPLPSGTGCAFMKLAKTKDDIAKVNTAVSVTMTDGECKDVKIALGSVAPTPIRVYDAEKILKGQKLDEQTISKAAEVAGATVKPITDVRSTAEYRREMATVLVKDALVKAADRANV